MSAKTLFLAAGLLGLAAAGVFEGRILFRQRDDLLAGQKRVAMNQRQAAALRGERDAAQKELRAAEQELAALPLPDAGAAARQSQVRDWLARLKRLQQLFTERAEQRIPELALLTDEDWLRAAQRASFEGEHETRKALADLRSRAKAKLSSRLIAALQRYAQAAGDEAPASILALAPHFAEPIDPAILQRYEIINDTRPGSPGSSALVAREKSPVDEDYDSRTELRSTGGLVSANGPVAWMPDFRERSARAHRAYADANDGKRPDGLGPVLPYFDPPLPAAKVELIHRFERERAAAGK